MNELTQKQTEQAGTDALRGKNRQKWKIYSSGTLAPATDSNWSDSHLH